MPRPQTSPRARAAAVQLGRLAARAGDLAELIPSQDAQARDWLDMLRDSSAWLNRYLKRRKISPSRSSRSSR